MSRTGIIIGLAILLVIVQSHTPVSAAMSEGEHSWNNGLRFATHVETFDFWVVDKPGMVFIRLTLLDPGTVVEFHKILCTIVVVGVTNQTYFVEKNSMLNQTGDYIDISKEFIVPPENVELNEERLYRVNYYFRYNLTVRLEGESTYREFYTFDLGPFPFNISDMEIIALWPYPIIILMGGLYWAGFIGLRKFNKRYKEVIEYEKETSPQW